MNRKNSKEEGKMVKEKGRKKRNRKKKKETIIKEIDDDTPKPPILVCNDTRRPHVILYSLSGKRLNIKS